MGQPTEPERRLANVTPMQLTSANADTAPTPSGGYVQAVAVNRATRLLFISGQIPETRDGTVPAGFEAQARLVWANLLDQLAAGGMGVANLVKVTTFLASRDHAEENSRIRQEVLAGHAVALTVIVTGIFDERWLLEIEAVAAA